MNLIKHIANLLALWTIPYIIVLFFLLVSGFAFTYVEAVSSGPFLFSYTVYFIIAFMVYCISDGEEAADHVRIFKIK